jgi:hypothetical protein
VDCVGSPFSQKQWFCLTLLTMVRRVAIREPREIHIVLEHTWNERGKCVAYWSGFPLQRVYRFESPRLSDMSNRLFVAVIT